MLLSRLSSNQTNPWFNFFIIEQIKSLKSIWLFGESSLFTFWFLMHVKNVIMMLNWFRISKLRMHWIVGHNLRITCLSSYWTHIIGSWITWVPHTHTHTCSHTSMPMDVHLYRYLDSSFFTVFYFVSHTYLSFAATSYQNTQGAQGENDPNNTTVGSLF